MSGCAAFVAVSRPESRAVGAAGAGRVVPVVGVNAAGRWGVLRDEAEAFGRAIIALPAAWGLGAGAPCCAVNVAAGAPPPPRASDCGRPRDPGLVPAEDGNCGRKTDSVRPLPSNRSPRMPRSAARFTGWMATWRTSVCVACAIREGGIPWLMTRLPLLMMLVDGGASLKIRSAC